MIRSFFEGPKWGNPEKYFQKFLLNLKSQQILRNLLTGLSLIRLSVAENHFLEMLVATETKKVEMKLIQPS